MSWLHAPMTIALGLALCVQQGNASEQLHAHAGYISDVKAERQLDFREVVYLNPNPPPPEPGFGAGLVDSKLSKEFQDRYEREFGYRQEEIKLYRDPGSSFQNSRGELVSTEEASDGQREFGAYMVRRLGEYHVDNYLKSDPKARTLYEAKERLSQANVSVSKSIRLDVKYYLSANDLRLKVENPWVDTGVLVEMGGSLGPGAPKETTLHLGKELVSSSYIESRYKLVDQQILLRWSRQLRSALVTSLTLTSYREPFRNGVERESSIWSIWTWHY